MVFLVEGKAGGKVVPINSGVLLLSSMLSKAGKNSLQVPLLNPKQIYGMDIYIPQGPSLLWRSGALLRLYNMNVKICCVFGLPWRDFPKLSQTAGVRGKPLPGGFKHTWAPSCRAVVLSHKSTGCI